MIDRCQASCIAVTCAIAFMLSRDPKFYRGDECNVKAVRDAAFSEAKQCFASLELEAVRLEDLLYFCVIDVYSLLFVDP